MKKYILCAFASVLFVATASAQNGMAKMMPLTAGDTVVNTAVITKILPTVTGGYSGLVIQPQTVVITGTLAGTMQLFASADGVDYQQQVDSTRNIMGWRPAPIWYVPYPHANFYKLVFTGAGTETAQWNIYYRYALFQTH